MEIIIMVLVAVGIVCFSYKKLFVGENLSLKTLALRAVILNIGILGISVILGSILFEDKSEGHFADTVVATGYMTSSNPTVINSKGNMMFKKSNITTGLVDDFRDVELNSDQYSHHLSFSKEIEDKVKLGDVVVTEKIVTAGRLSGMIVETKFIANQIEKVYEKDLD